ncbi:MAG TPA: hypothetical protein VJ385_15720 [Fibrobacteria bacterium]|nr:hypothetical protein [Fibrobacteria bacterium]
MTSKRRSVKPKNIPKLSNEAETRQPFENEVKSLGLTPSPGPHILFSDRVQVLARQDNLMLLRFFSQTPTGFQEEARVMAPFRVMQQLSKLINQQIEAAQNLGRMASDEKAVGDR